MPGAPLAEVARTALSRHEWDRVLHALLRGRRRLPQSLAERGAVAECPLESVAGGEQGVDHRLVARLCLAAFLDTGDPGLERGRPVVGAELALAGDGRPHPEEERPVERAAGAPDRRHERHADGLQQGADFVPAGLVVDLGHHRGHTAAHVDPMIRVSDGRVELREVLLVRLDVRGEPLQPLEHVVVGNAHPAAPPTPPT